MQQLAECTDVRQPRPISDEDAAAGAQAFPAENDEGNVEYKLRLKEPNCSPVRFQQLVCNQLAVFHCLLLHTQRPAVRVGQKPKALNYGHTEKGCFKAMHCHTGMVKLLCSDCCKEHHSSGQSNVVCGRHKAFLLYHNMMSVCQVTQMKYRLAEGNGECFYFVGECPCDVLVACVSYQCNTRCCLAYHADLLGSAPCASLA